MTKFSGSECSVWFVFLSSVFFPTVFQVRLSNLWKVLHNAKRIAKKEEVEAENVQVATNDEVKEISQVLNEMRFERDTLTRLYTKNAVETIFNKRHQNYDYVNQKFE